jgi:hypothetical protein
MKLTPSLSAVPSLLFAATTALLITSAAHAADRSYLVLMKPGQAEARLDSAVKQAEGQITREIPQATILVARSGNPDFSNRLGRSSAVEAVVPNLQVESLLRRSADDLGKPGKDDYFGGGWVNALKGARYGP